MSQIKPSLHINVLRTISTDIHIGKITPAGLQKVVRQYALGNYAVIVTNPKINALYHRWIRDTFSSVPHAIMQVPDAEQAKSFTWLQKIIETIARQDAPVQRKVFLVCFGGGVVGDVAGCAASLYRRGIPYIQVPTTLLAQIDSSVGGKVAVNIPQGKNLVGSFYHPACVLTDSLFLKTLQNAQLQEGLSEALKYGLISDRALFSLLCSRPRQAQIFRRDPAILREIIIRCLRIKSSLVSKDEQEKKGLRTFLNFGHTIAHALEGCFSYQTLSHGKAVSLGMVAAAYISSRKGLCSSALVEKIEKTAAALGLPVRYLLGKKRAAIMRHLFYDKKFTTGTIRMVLIKNVGDVAVVEGIDPVLVQESLQYVEGKEEYVCHR